MYLYLNLSSKQIVNVFFLHVHQKLLKKTIYIITGWRWFGQSP